MDKLNSKNTMEIQKFSSPSNTTNPSFTVPTPDISQLTLIHKNLSSLYKKSLSSLFSFSTFLQTLTKSSFSIIALNHHYSTLLPQDQQTIQTLINFKSKSTLRLQSLKQENFDL